MYFTLASSPLAVHPTQEIAPDVTTLTSSPDTTKQPAASVRLLTEQQAATAAGVSRKTIRRLIEQGRLVAADYGTATQHNYRIHPDALANVQSAPKPGSEPMPPARHSRYRRQSAVPAELSAVWP